MRAAISKPRAIPLGIGNGVGKQGRGNQPPYRRYGPDTEIQYRPRFCHMDWQEQAEFSPKGKPIRNFRKPQGYQNGWFSKWQVSYQRTTKGQNRFGTLSQFVLRSPAPRTEYKTPPIPKIRPKIHLESRPETKNTKKIRKISEYRGFSYFFFVIFSYFGFGTGFRVYFGVYFGDRRGFVFCTGRRRSQSLSHFSPLSTRFQIFSPRTFSQN